MKRAVWASPLIIGVSVHLDTGETGPLRIGHRLAIGLAAWGGSSTLYHASRIATYAIGLPYDEAWKVYALELSATGRGGVLLGHIRRAAKPFVVDLAHVRGSDTSRAAAHAKKMTEEVDERRIVDFLTKRGRIGATDDEIERAMHRSHQSVSARRRGLVLKGEVVDTGIRRRTRTGRLAAVWVLGNGTVYRHGPTPRVPRPSLSELRRAERRIARLAADELKHGRLEVKKLCRWLTWITRTSARRKTP